MGNNLDCCSPACMTACQTVTKDWEVCGNLPSGEDDVNMSSARMIE